MRKLNISGLKGTSDKAPTTAGISPKRHIPAIKQLNQSGITSETSHVVSPVRHADPDNPLDQLLHMHCTPLRGKTRHDSQAAAPLMSHVKIVPDQPEADSNLASLFAFSSPGWSVVGRAFKLPKKKSILMLP